MTSLIRAAAFIGFNDLVTELGADPREILSAFNISPRQLDCPDDMLSESAFVGALQMASEVTGRPDFGLRLGIRQDVKMLGPLGLLARHCDSACEALNVIGRHIKLHNAGAVVELEMHGDTARLRYDDSAPGFTRNAQICDLALALGVDLLRYFLGEHWRPRAVFFAHKKHEDITYYRQTFDAPLYFDQDLYAIEFDAAAAHVRTTESDREMKQFFSQYVDQLESQYRRDIVSVVEQLIRSLLGTGQCCEERIADVLQMNRRTLQRKLKSADTSFNQILSKTRIEMAEQCLRESDMSLTDLAISLGYSELSAFTRFFKSKCGVSPSQYKTKRTALV